MLPCQNTATYAKIAKIKTRMNVWPTFFKTTLNTLTIDMKHLLKPQPHEPQNLRAGDRIRHPLRGEGQVIAVNKPYVRLSFGETWGVLPENTVRKI